MVYKSKKYTIQNVTKEAKETDDDDYIVKTMGAFGTWQLMFVTIAVISRVVSSWNTLTIVFLTPATDFVCTKFNDNTTMKVVNNTCYDNCVKYEFVRNVFEENFVTEFGLICDDAWLASFTQTMLMFGLTCGVSFYGWLSDRYGRGKSTWLAGLNCLIFMFAMPFCPTYWTVTATRFFIGLGSGGIFALTAVFISEIVGTKIIDIIICGALPSVDGAAMPVLAAIAYFSLTWRTFSIIFSSISVLLLIFTWFLPETPRWLIAKKRVSDAVAMMTKVVKFNGGDTSNIKENVRKSTEQLSLEEGKDLNLTYLDLFKTRKLAIMTIASVMIWFATGFSYFGLLQYTSQFGSNVYIIFTVMGFFHISASPVSIIILKFCGRKVACIGIFIAIGIISVSLILTPEKSTAAIILGSFGVTASTTVFSVIYVYVIELYPTPVRNMGLSLSSVGSKVAAMVAPFVVNMKTRWIASSIFAAASFIAVLFCFLLPETKGKPLKDTMDDV